MAAALARAGHHGRIVPGGEEIAAIAMLPLGTLRLSPDCILGLNRIGLQRIGERGRIATAAGKTLVAIKAMAARFNAISEGLSIAPERHAPIFERTDDGMVLPQPWCMGFLTGMRLRQQKWNPLLDLSSMDHGLMLPILLYCTPSIPIAFTSSSTDRVEMPWMYASWITAVSAFSAMRRGSSDLLPANWIVFE